MILRLTLCLLLLATAVWAQPGPDSLSSRVYGTVGGGVSTSLQHTPDGGYMAAGYGDTGSISQQMLLIRTNPSGDSLWGHFYGGAYRTSCTNLISAENGGFVIAGNSAHTNATTWDVGLRLIKVDSAGTVQWDYSYSQGDTVIVCVSVAPTYSDDGFAAVGYTHGLGDYEHLWAAKIAHSGDLLGIRYFDSDVAATGAAIQETHDGGYIVAGTIHYSDPTDSNLVLLAKSDAMGSPEWERMYGGTWADKCVAVQTTNDGGYVVAGVTAVAGSRTGDFWLFKTDSEGNLIWNHTYGGPDWDNCRTMTETRDGGFLLAGSTTLSGGTQYGLVMRTDANGNLLWSQNYGDGEYNDLFAVTDDGDGGYSLSGTTMRWFPTWGVHDWWGLKLGTDCYGCPLLAPEITVNISGSDAVLHWPPVLGNECGQPYVAADEYCIFIAPTVEGPFSFLTVVTEPTFTHVNATRFNPQLYYQVVAYRCAPTDLRLRMPSGR